MVKSLMSESPHVIFPELQTYHVGYPGFEFNNPESPTQNEDFCPELFAGKAQFMPAGSIQGLNVNHECVEGVPAREIIAYAEANKMDLIAMATHGRGEVAWVLGSTAEKVVTHATVPTLLFRVMETKIPEFKDTQKWRLGMP